MKLTVSNQGQQIMRLTNLCQEYESEIASQ